MKIIISVLFLAFTCQLAFSQSIKEGLALLDNDNVPAARKVFQIILQKNPKDAGAWYYLGEMAYHDEKSDSAAWFYNKAREANPDSYFAHVGNGTIQLDKNMKSEADKSFGKALRAAGDKEKAFVHSLIGEAYLTSRFPNYDKAIQAFTEARDLDTKNAKAFVQLGDAYLAKGQVGDALSSYELASNKDKNNPEILMKIARAYYKNNISDVATEQLEGVIQLFPDYAPAYKDLYQIYFAKGQFSKVTPLLEKYVSLVGNDVEQRARLVKFLTFQAKDYKRAIQEAYTVLEQDPHYYPMHRWLAWAYFEEGDFQKSFEMSGLFFKHAGNRPIYASDYEYYAKAASKIGNVEAAVTNYKKVLELDSTRTEVHDFIAKAYYENKNWQEAEKAYVTKIASGKTTNQDWYYLGMAQYQQNKNAEADSTFAKLTEKQPTYATGWMMRARANNRLDPDRVNYLAKPFYEKYIELASADPEKYKKQLVEAYNFIGYYASQHEDLPGAIVWYEKSVALDPANEEAVGALKQLKEITGGKK